MNKHNYQDNRIYIVFWYSISSLLEEVKAITSYVAKNRRGENGIVNQDLILNLQDEPIFKNFLEDAISAVNDCLSSYDRTTPPFFSKDEEEINDRIQFPLSMPKAFRVNLIPSIDTEIKRMIVNSILTDWFFITSPDDSTMYAAKAEDASGALLSKLNTRNGTVKRPFLFP